MDFLKWVAAGILLIMAITWAIISIQLNVMIAVSNDFLTIAGALVSIVSGQGIKDIIVGKFGTVK